MAAVGFDLYTRLLAEAVEEQKAVFEARRSWIERPQAVGRPARGRAPARRLRPDEAQKLELYRRLARARRRATWPRSARRSPTGFGPTAGAGPAAGRGRRAAPGRRAAGIASISREQVPGGFIGVDLFFVVSGFLITGLLIREREKTGKDQLRRVLRPARAAHPAGGRGRAADHDPALLLAGHSHPRPDTMQDGASAALSIANIRFALTTDYFNPVNYSPFLHFWSLGVEEQFYLVWPALLLRGAWRGRAWGRRRPALAVLVVSFAASLYMTDEPELGLLHAADPSLAAGRRRSAGRRRRLALPGCRERSSDVLSPGILVIAGWRRWRRC
jgi:hypothetical protein